MNQSWSRVYTSDKAYQIEIAAALLDEEGIASFRVDKKDSSYSFGEIELYVDSANQDLAKLKLIEHDLL